MSTRRTILLGGVAAVGELVLAGCDVSSGAATPVRSASTSGASSTSAPTSTSQGSATPSPTVTPGGPVSSNSSSGPSTGRTSSSSPASTSPSSSSSPSKLWTPGPGELEPDIKSVAVSYVAAQVNSSALQVFDAQYGGLLDTSASVLVVTSVGTFDVRLVQATPHWRVTEVHPSQPGAAASTLTAAATALLAESRVTLPPAAQADVRSGQVHDTVLNVLLSLAKEHELTVSVVRSGHPIDVFGTTRPSDHPRGRAVDVWRVDGHAVVDPATPTALVDNLMRRAAALGSYNVGGPRQLSGSQFFSDRTHHDHVHMGFTT